MMLYAEAGTSWWMRTCRNFAKQDFLSIHLRSRSAKISTWTQNHLLLSFLVECISQVTQVILKLLPSSYAEAFLSRSHELCIHELAKLLTSAVSFWGQGHWNWIRKKPNSYQFTVSSHVLMKLAFLMESLHRRYFNWGRLKTSARNVLALENSNYSKNVATAIPIKRKNLSWSLKINFFLFCKKPSQRPSGDPKEKIKVGSKLCVSTEVKNRKTNRRL